MTATPEPDRLEHDVRATKFLTATAVAASLLAVPGVATADGHGALVTVVHGIPDTTVDIYVNGAEAIPDFEYKTITDPIEFAAGDYEIDIFLDGEGPGGTPVLELNTPLADGDDLAVVAHLDAAGAPKLSAFVNDVSELPSFEARLTVRHTAAAPAVDILADGTPAFEGLTNPNEEVADIAESTFDVAVNAAGTSTTVTEVEGVTIPAGRNTVVYAVGDLDDGTVELLVDTYVLNVFVDDDGSIFEDNHEWMAANGITFGCNPPINNRYCGDDDVTRGQMAAFLNRALPIEASSVDAFTDDDDSIFEKDIQAIAAADITRGCNPPDNDRFCPDDDVTRGQMAAFLTRALDLPASDVDAFTDDDDSIFEADIQAIAAAGITFGCNPPDNDRFCPDDTVTRSQMAAFMERALG